MHAPVPPYLKTLTECLKKMEQDGYTENFSVEDGRLKAPSKDKFFDPSEVTIDNFFRFEGQSDPADNTILYAIKTSDNTKGTLVDAYGADADPDKSMFIKEVEDIHKKLPA